MKNDLITADMIEADEFPELSEKYGVYYVPKVVINDKIEFVGSLPEEEFLEKVIESQ
ncbi:MAG: thioredoxin family protein [Candidatus Altarchaeaceae archaeon]